MHRGTSALHPEAERASQPDATSLASGHCVHLLPCPLMTLKLTSGKPQSVMSRDVPEVLRNQIAWRQITDVA